MSNIPFIFLFQVISYDNSMFCRVELSLDCLDNGFRQLSGFVDKSPKVYTQLAREGVVLTQDSDNI